MAHSDSQMTFVVKSEEEEREKWNKVSKMFKDKWVVDMHAQMTAFLDTHLDWLAIPEKESLADPRELRMLDYACGNGIITRSLYNKFDHVLGVDLSDAMVKLYEETLQKLDLSIPGQGQAVRGNLLDNDPAKRVTEPPLPQDKLSGFDLVAFSMALHHVEDPLTVMSHLANLLRPGGVLLVVDRAELVPDDKPAHGHGAHGHASGEHKSNCHGPRMTCGSFLESDMAKLFHEAGCEQPDYLALPDLSPIPKFGAQRLFFARAIKK